MHNIIQEMHNIIQQMAVCYVAIGNHQVTPLSLLYKKDCVVTYYLLKKYNNCTAVALKNLYWCNIAEYNWKK